MADSGYDAEVKSIMAFLSMQHPASQPAINPATLDINIEDYVAPRFMRKIRSKVGYRKSHLLSAIRVCLLQSMMIDHLIDYLVIFLSARRASSYICTHMFLRL